VNPRGCFALRLSLFVREEISGGCASRKSNPSLYVVAREKLALVDPQRKTKEHALWYLENLIRYDYTRRALNKNMWSERTLAGPATALSPHFEVKTEYD
jgi:hypothetical protein